MTKWQATHPTPHPVIPDLYLFSPLVTWLCLVTQAVQGLCPANLAQTPPGTSAPLPVPGYKSLNTHPPWGGRNHRTLL
jgi:hypothetical protein